MVGVIINELLCFLINKHVKLTKGQLKSTLVNFYTDKELDDAKDLLFEETEKLVSIDDRPRNIKRKGDNRHKLIADDLIELLSVLDERKCISLLPVYAAHNLDRVPHVRPEDMDVFCMAQKLEAFEVRMGAIETQNVAHNGLMAKMDDLVARLNTLNFTTTVHATSNDATDGPSTSQSSTHPQQLDCVSIPLLSSADGCPTSYADKLKATAVHETTTEPWQTVSYGRNVQKCSSIRVRGSRDADNSDSSTVRAVPRKTILAAFVGRLCRDTSEENLTNYLKNEGMRGVVCRKIKPKEGHKFNTAAFYVTCSAESANLFYDENCWPDGAELRDWIYK